MNIQGRTKPQIERRVPSVPAEHDWDWEYTGEFFMCLECGHEIDEPPYDFEVCPKCGADFWPEED